MLAERITEDNHTVIWLNNGVLELHYAKPVYRGGKEIEHIQIGTLVDGLLETMKTRPYAEAGKDYFGFTSLLFTDPVFYIRHIIVTWKNDKHFSLHEISRENFNIEMAKNFYVHHKGYERQVMIEVDKFFRTYGA